MSDEMTSSKPYIVRAFYDWISDNQLTPYIVVDVNVYGVLVPMSYVNDGQITLNISSSAVGAISMAGEQIAFSARFGGKLENIVVPFGAVAAIFAKENGAGTTLAIEHPEVEELPEETTPAPLSTVSSDDDDKALAPKSASKSRASLKVVK
ncbi:MULTISPECIES: ClpXP protease specificity-enhancing factor [Thalassotalea]|uniref:ClpXP protease specificity-enhancing factor n=1 Tax=Thalassotalea castellviae TaxID=3075612 RepID=A0ABU3A4J8_9GAMM|nr:ClpXP protease specificity-enhancing factor [Thalassotalea sp. W431]MDT0605110.1 ClpXP protease specificity-enhancing factor [Thalassotalea sp. W431]